MGWEIVVGWDVKGLEKVHEDGVWMGKLMGLG